MIGGAAAMVFQAGVLPDQFTLEELIDLVKSERSIIYYVCILVVLSVASLSYYFLLVTLKKFERYGEVYVIAQKLSLPQSPEKINITDSTFVTRDTVATRETVISEG
jgi:hypothetical protein